MQVTDLKVFRLGADGHDLELQGSAVALEVDLQRRIEAGMEQMLGIRFVASEYPTGPWHRGRIDSLGLDENGTPVIIEYKKGSDHGVVTQAVSYLSWLKSSRHELLRFDSPVSMATFRFATEAISLGSTEIPAGSPVLIAPGAANRDPARFPDPDRLDLARDSKGHLAFGHGIHRCLGAPLARAEGEIAFRRIVTRFPRLRLAVPSAELRWRHTRLMRGLEALPVLP